MLYSASVFQGELWLGSAEGTSAADVEREIRHYAAIYGQDGPVEIKRNCALKTWRQFTAQSAAPGEGRG